VEKPADPPVKKKRQKLVAAKDALRGDCIDIEEGTKTDGTPYKRYLVAKYFWELPLNAIYQTATSRENTYLCGTKTTSNDAEGGEYLVFVYSSTYPIPKEKRRLAKKRTGAPQASKAAG
jgi:hypothetical protein